MNRLVSRPFGLARLEDHTRKRPSGLKCGNPSKPGDQRDALRLSARSCRGSRGRTRGRRRCPRSSCRGSGARRGGRWDRSWRRRSGSAAAGWCRRRSSGRSRARSGRTRPCASSARYCSRAAPVGAAGPPHDLRAVGAEERAAVVAGAGGQALRSARLVHHVEVEVAVAHGREDQLSAAAAPRRLGVVARRLGEAPRGRAVRRRLVEVVAVVERPDVALRLVGRGRALRGRAVRRGVDDAVALRPVEVAAGGAAACPWTPGGRRPWPGPSRTADRIRRRRWWPGR